MSVLRQLASQTVVYGLSSVLGRIINYLLVPVYTAVFTLAEYGVVTELYAYLAFLNILYTYGFETAYFRFASQNKSEASNYYNIAQTSLILSSVALSGVFYLFSDTVAELLDYEGQGHYIRWLALILAIDTVVAIPFARLRLEKRAYKFAGIKLFNICLNVGLNLFFIVLCPYLVNQGYAGFLLRIYDAEIGVGYVFLSNLIANAVQVLFFGDYLIRFRWSLSGEWKTMFRYAAPLMVLGFAGVTNEMLSRVLLKYLLPQGYYQGFSNQEVLGIFGACYKLSVFMVLAVQAFRYAFEPFFFANASNENSKRDLALTMHGFVVFGCFSWLLISLFLDELAPVFLRNSDYLTGLGIVPWLLGASLFLGVYVNLSAWYKLSDKTIYGAWISLGGALFTVLMNVILIPLFGYIGSAIVSFLTYFLMCIASFLLGRRHYRIPYFVRRTGFYPVFTTVLLLTFYFCGFEGILKYAIAVGIMGIYLAVFWTIDVRTGFLLSRR